jgi:hypothetical protein
MAHSPQPDMCCISFTHVSVASMWVVALHSLFLYSDPPPLCHLPSNWLRLFSSQTFSCTNTPTFSTPVILHTYLPMNMEKTECSEMLAYKIQTLGNYPEESIQHSEQAKVWNQELWDVFVMDWVLFLHVPAVRPSWWIVFVPHFKQWRLPRARILYRNIILSDKCH